MSLGAKITGLDLGPVIICCQIFLSMKWNNSRISANLCPPSPSCAQIFMQCKTISRYCSLNLWGFFQPLIWPRGCSLSFTACVTSCTEVFSLLGGGESLSLQMRGVLTSILHLFVWEANRLKRRRRQRVERHLRTTFSCQTIIKQLSSSHVYPPLISTRKYKLEENCYYPSEDWTCWHCTSTPLIKREKRAGLVLIL